MCSCNCSTFKEERFIETREDGKSIYKITEKCSKCHRTVREYYEYR